MERTGYDRLHMVSMRERSDRCPSQCIDRSRGARDHAAELFKCVQQPSTKCTTPRAARVRGGGPAVLRGYMFCWPRRPASTMSILATRCTTLASKWQRLLSGHLFSLDVRQRLLSSQLNAGADWATPKFALGANRSFVSVRPPRETPPTLAADVNRIAHFNIQYPRGPLYSFFLLHSLYFIPPLGHTVSPIAKFTKEKLLVFW